MKFSVPHIFAIGQVLKEYNDGEVIVIYFLPKNLYWKIKVYYMLL